MYQLQQMWRGAEIILMYADIEIGGEVKRRQIETPLTHWRALWNNGIMCYFIFAQKEKNLRKGRLL